MSDQGNEGRSRGSDFRGRTARAYEPAGLAGAVGARPQRGGPGAHPAVPSVPDSAPVMRPPFGAQAPTGDRPRVPRDETGSEPVIPKPAEAPARGNMRGRRSIFLDVTRPESALHTKKGLTGQMLQLQANYFEIQRKKDWGIYQYHVDFSPELDVTGVRKALLRPYKAQYGTFIFDGTILLTTTRWPEDKTELSTKRLDDSVVKITVKFIKEVSMTESASLQILNLILRSAMEKLNLQLVGRNFFDPVAKIEIPDFRLELWPGYVTSVRQHENGILMCAEISSKVMRQENLLSIYENCVKNHRDYKDQFARTVVGSTVLTDYNNKTYRIDDVDWDRTPKSTFESKGTEISFMSYYQTKYNIRIRSDRQPLLVSRSNDRQRRQGQSDLIALIPELCRATGFTDDMRNNFRLMKAVADHTRVGPAQRIRRLMSFNERLRQTPECVQSLLEWKMRVSPQLVQMAGRELPPEKIVFANRDANGTIEADWTRDLRSNKLFTCIGLENWHVIAPNRARKETTDFIKVLQEASVGMSMRIAQPQLHMIESDRNEDVLRALEECIRADPQLIMIVVSNNNQARYAAIKKKCCVERAIPTQVMVQKTITPKGGNPRGLLSVGTKVAIQLNCKLGAAPWFVKLPLVGLMIVGFDVYHDTKNKAVSYGALVASMDLRESCKYFSAVSAHRNGEELSNQLTLNFTKALKEYHAEHGNLPARIIMYRDGVGEGQLHYVFEHELEHLKEAINTYYAKVGQEAARFAFIVVNKRINTRIFNKERNPNPGTVVDDVITLPERYDFYLVSQCVRQGTVSPTSYNVIYDTMGLPPDKLQILTFKMCHLYYNWSGTVAVPAVCQYAHKLADLVGEHLHQSPNQSLSKRLYFL